MTPVSAPTRERTVWNIFFVLFSQILIVGTAFITTPILVKKLGADAYGVVILLSTILNYMGFLDLGLSSATIQYLTECVSSNDWERFRRIAWSSLITYSGIGVIGGTIFFFFIPEIVSSWFKIPPKLQSASIKSLYLFVSAFVAGLLMQTPRAVIWAHNRIDLASMITLISAILQPILAILMVFAGYGIVGVSLATLIANLATLLLAVQISARFYNKWGKPVYDIKSLKPLIRYGSWITFTQLFNQVVTSLDKIFIAKYLNTAAVGYYNLSVSIPIKLWIIHGAFASSALPLLIGLKTRAASSHEIYYLMSRLIRGVQLLSLPAVLFFIFWGDIFLRVWINEEFAQAGKFSIRLVSMAMLLSGVSAIYHTSLRAWGRADLSSIAYIITGVMYIPLLYLLIRWSGISGAGLALVMYAVIEMFILLIFLRSLFRISISAWFPIVVNRHLFPIIAIGGSVALLTPLVSWKPLWKLMTLGGTFLVLSGLYVWFIGFSKSDRNSILKSITERFISSEKS